MRIKWNYVCPNVFTVTYCTILNTPWNRFQHPPGVLALQVNKRWPIVCSNYFLHICLYFKRCARLFLRITLSCFTRRQFSECSIKMDYCNVYVCECLPVCVQHKCVQTTSTITSLVMLTWLSLYLSLSLSICLLCVFFLQYCSINQLQPDHLPLIVQQGTNALPRCNFEVSENCIFF